MRLTASTSLFIIAMKSASGFYKYIDVLAAQNLRLDWGILTTVTVLGIVDSLVGGYFSTRLQQAVLLKLFGVVLIAMAAYILWRELIPGN